MESDYFREELDGCSGCFALLLVTIWCYWDTYWLWGRDDVGFSICYGVGAKDDTDFDTVNGFV